ncbi:MAG: helix-turn-helix domain-containing protein [Actinomycetia bacterium]|nr:helix-turn-helix domain-containing protein [Actinomycetes bacterium]
MTTARTDRLAAAEFGKRVRAARENVGLTQESLAERIGSHRTFPGAIERGEVGPTLTSIIRLAAALEVDPSVLVRGIKPAGRRGTARPRRRA